MATDARDYGGGRTSASLVTIDEKIVDDPYMQLPESIRLSITPNEYRWMTDSQKSALVSNFTEPEF